MARPLLLETSSTILGNDGNWTTYAIQVGNPPQTFDVIPSTVLSDTWTINPAVCSSKTGNAQANCAAFRGDLFDPSSSHSWQPLFNDINLYISAPIEQSYGWPNNTNGSFGQDQLILSSDKGSVPVSGSVIGSVNTNATNTGLLGLGSKPISLDYNGQNFDNGSLLQILRDAGTIPSMSFSYSAGAWYNGTNGILVLGGYDNASYIPNNVQFQFAPSNPDNNNYLSVGLLSISAKADGNTTSLSDSSVQALIDSTISDLWLPESWCDKFEAMFNLSYNGNTQLYTLGPDAIASNNKNNPTVTIEIANTQNANGNTVSINFPWSAFNKTYTSLTETAFSNRPYFSIRRSSGPYTLGRAFLQEAVLTVDHERQTFSVSQVVDLSHSQPQLVSISSLSSASPGGGSGNSTTTPDTSSSGGGISGGAIGGIVVAVVVVAAIIAGFFLWRRRNRRRRYGAPGEARADTAGPQRLPPSFNEKSAAAEMPTPRPGNSNDMLDYHAQQRQNIKAAMAMSNNDTSELQGDGTHGERAQSPLPAYRPGSGPISVDGSATAVRAELPANRAASELHSEHASPMSSPHLSPPISELAPSPGDEGPLATAADMGWGTSPGEPQSPHSAESVSLSPIRGVHMRDVRNLRTGLNSPGVGSSNRSSDVVPTMSATSGPMGLGIHDRDVPSESLRRQDSTRSRNSDQTLVSGSGTNNIPASSVSAALHSAQNVPRKPTARD